MSDIDDRLDRLETRVDEQQTTIERYRRTFAALKTVTAVALVAVVLALTATGVGADPQGMVGTADDPLQALFTEELNGGVTDDEPVTDLTGPGVTIDDGSLSADPARPNVSDGTTTVENVTTITYGSELSVTDNGDGTVTVGSTAGSGTTAAFDVAFVRPPFDGEIVSERLARGGDSIVGTVTRGTSIRVRASDGVSPVAGIDVDYGVGDPAAVTLSPGEASTNATGYANATLVHGNDSVTELYAAAGGASAGQQVTVDRLLNESFEDDADTLVSNGWRYEANGSGGDAGVRRDSTAAPVGNRYAYIDGSASGPRAIELNYTLDTRKYEALTLTYVAREPGSSNGPSGSPTDPSENLSVEYRDASGSWVEVDNVSAGDENTDPVVHYRRVRIEGVDNASHRNFKLRFTQGEADVNDEWQIDGVELVGLNTSAVSDLNQAPRAHFRYGPANLTAGDTVTFWANRSDDPDGEDFPGNGNYLRYDWDWDDDGNYEGSGEQATHSFASSGTRTVTLRVTDARGETTTASQIINVTSGASP